MLPLVNICISFVFLFTATSYAFVLYVNLLWSPALGVKLYGFPWWLLLFFCLHLRNLSCYFSTRKCNQSWYLDDVKSIVLSLRPTLNLTLIPIYHHQKAWGGHVTMVYYLICLLFTKNKALTLNTLAYHVF